MFKGNLALVRDVADEIFPGIISPTVKGDGSEEIEIPIPDDSAQAKKTVEYRIEQEISDEIETFQAEENSKLLVNGIKYCYMKLENGNIISKIRKGGTREWQLFDAENRKYSSVDSKGTEVFGEIIEIRKVEKRAPKAEKLATESKPKAPPPFVPQFWWLGLVKKLKIEIQLRFRNLAPIHLEQSSQSKLPQ